MWLEQQDRCPPSIALHIHIGPKREPCGDINPRRKVEDTAVVRKSASDARRHCGVDGCRIVGTPITSGPVISNADRRYPDRRDGRGDTNPCVACCRLRSLTTDGAG